MSANVKCLQIISDLIAYLINIFDQTIDTYLKPVRPLRLEFEARMKR